MRYLGKIVILTITVLVLTLSLALAGSKFPNKDTAKDRQDTTMGTQPTEEEPVIIINQKKNEDTSIQTKRPKKEEEDWYDKVIISVEPQVDVE